MKTGHLKGIVLNCLEARPDSGYGIMASIKNNTGWKPSTGSMYPLLQEMRNEGLVAEKKDEKKKIYHLTAKGKLELEQLKKSHEKIIDEVIKVIRTFSSMSSIEIS